MKKAKQKPGKEKAPAKISKAIKQPLNLDTPLAKLKAGLLGKREKIKLPKFELKEPSKIIVLPDGKESVKYVLIEPFASAEIKKVGGNEMVYTISEPQLSKEEQKIYEQIVGGLMEILDVELSSIKEHGEALKYLMEKTEDVAEELNIKLKDESYRKILYYIYRNLIGFNEIEAVLKDPYVEDISCDGTGIPIYVVHRRYGSLKSNIIFKDENTLKDFVVKLAERAGRFISYAEPLLDGTLPDGNRVQASFSKDVTSKGPTFTIRKFAEEPFSPVELIKNGTCSEDVFAYLWLAVESGASVLIAGGTATGKTSMLNALSMFIPSASKIVSIEDTRELNLPHENWIPSVTRPAFSKGYGEITLFDLLKSAFRQSPDYVIVGEVRGQEAYVMFQGMSAGMPSIGTFHAGKMEDVLNRLQSPPINLSPALIESLDLIVVMVHAREKGENARRLKEIVEIESIDTKTGTARTNRVYNWEPADDTFGFAGTSWLVQKISQLKGRATEDLEADLKNRKNILEWMKKNNVVRFRDVSKIVSDYQKDPEDVLKRLKLK